MILCLSWPYIRTCSVFVIIAEVKINGSAEFQNIAPLVLVDNFVLRLLLKTKIAVIQNAFGTKSLGTKNAKANFANVIEGVIVYNINIVVVTFKATKHNRNYLPSQNKMKSDERKVSSKIHFSGIHCTGNFKEILASFTVSKTAKYCYLLFLFRNHK